MSCSKCCGFKPFFGKVDYVIRDYDPTENFNDYIVPTWWINRKRKVAWFLVSKEGGKAVWVPLQFGTFIQKILTDCGEILPENGQIEFKQGLGIVFKCDGSKLTFNLDIPIIAKYGGTGYTEYKIGDLLVGNLDGTLSKLAKGETGQVLSVKEDGTLGYIDIVQKLNCSEDPVTENALVRWDKNGKCLKNSKTVQNDQGNTNTRTSLDGTLNFITANNSEDPESSAVHELESKGGRPIRRYLIPEKQLVDTYIDNKDYSYKIFLNDLEEGKGGKDCFRINREGNITIPHQYTAFAVLTENTGSIAKETEYFLGQGTPLTIISNKGGYFFAGGGSVSNPAKFTVFEENTFQVYTSAYITTSELTQTEITARIRVNGSRSRSTSFLIVQGNTIDKGSALVQTGVEGLPGDIITFSFYARSGGTTQTWKLIKEIGDTYTTFVGIRCLG